MIEKVLVRDADDEILEVRIWKLGERRVIFRCDRGNRRSCIKIVTTGGLDRGK